MQILIVPVWIGDHEGEEPDPDVWYKGHAISVDNQPLTLLGFGPFFEDAKTILDTVVSSQARCWTVGNIIKSKDYSPEIELALREPPYGVVEGDIIEIEEVEVVNAGKPSPKPTLEVPPYCCWVKPRVDMLSPELVQQLRKCSITVDDEGQLVED